ncbi:hypothetical protein F5884DRAFT_858225 [Xylogone sp. PMI_703]|nr:hypothetical protein F5884DRAFT_858225 [Xylogone sp. PMI_703]
MAVAPRSGLSRQPRMPLLLFTFIAGSGVYFGLKWRAVMQRSEAAKKASAPNFFVVPGRSGGGI